MLKLINIICHPSQIVLYFNDKVYKIILWLLSFLIIIVGIIVAYSFKIGDYDYTLTDGVINTITLKEEALDIKYNDSKLTGTSYAIKGDGVYIYFCKSDFVHNDYGLVMNFKEDHVDIYYRLFSKVSFNYSDSGVANFSFEDIKYNRNSARIYFESLFNQAQTKIAKEKQLMFVLDNGLNLLMMYALALGFSIVFSLFINPLIKFPHRLRICVYDSLIYLIFMVFVLMIQVSWLQYVALVLPLIYTNISFRKIVVIKR